MFKSLSSLWSSGPSLNYSVEEPFGSAFGTWIHYSGKSKEDESEVSVFKMQCSDVLDPRMIAAKNGVKRLRTIKHPNVLEFKDSLELEQGEKSGGEPVIYLVTEPVKPLKQVLRELNLDSSAKEQYLSWGLHQITKAVSFLSNDCKLIHGNVCLDAIVVTEQLDWKLHGFDMLTEYDQADAYDSPLKLYSNTVAEQYKCEEVRKGDYALVKRSPPWAVDSWGLGCLVQELFRGGELSKMDELRDTKVIPPVVLKDYTRLLGSNPNKRLNPSKLLETNEFFMNKLVDTIRFLEDLNLKDSAEKENYFRRLPIVLETLVDAIAQKKVLPLLAKALEFGSAPAVALDPLLQIAKTVPSDEYPGKVVPCLVKLYASTDRQIRTTLLTNMDTYIEHMSPTVVDEQVFPNLASGFTDATPFLRELTLKSTLALAPKLSQRTINQNLLKHLAKLQASPYSSLFFGHVL
ncbi:hypothetical protein CYMTET_7730 [Cymbomonas tetramitiformis]|uniref:Protein kinase domain-containing protein n=1 Tax=Cymbomonas tetramitiformis TaxID=36881 RepID=A0AAE0LGP5_9CHLO|nr:hypothetical protein CYMTET_7730 [Cymbomonas tetramitiformis]